MTRTSKTTWLEEGLTLLSNNDVSTLTVDLLCERLEMTKGSFYYHFKNRPTYLETLLDYWEDKFTAKFIEYSEQGRTTREKIQRLTELVVQGTKGPEVSIRAWALHDPTARAVQARVDHRRIAYIQRLHIELGTSDSEALLWAQIMYTILIGSQHLMPPLEPDQMTVIYNKFRATFDL